jgi:hypothetical protein
MHNYNFALPHIVHPGLLPLFPDPRDAFCHWFSDFGRRLAPLDFGTTPLYVVDVPLGGPSYTVGFAGQSLDLCYHEQIGGSVLIVPGEHPARRGREHQFGFYAAGRYRHSAGRLIFQLGKL